MVTIRFESEPPGAHVVRVTDDKDLGAVPFELKLPRAGGKPEYRFHLDGYQDQTLAIDLGSDQTLKRDAGEGRPRRRRRRRQPPPAAPAAARRDAAPAGAGGPRTTRRVRRAPSGGDDDGLATPKF